MIVNVIGVFDDLNIQTANIDEALGDVYGSGIPQTEVSSNLCKVNELIDAKEIYKQTI